MRMLENEDSVVTSLNELRKLKHERITRQTQTRAVVGSGRAAALAVDPASEQMTPPPVSVSSLSHAQPASFGSLAPQASAAPFGNFAAQPAGYAAPVIQTKTSYKAAVVMTLLLGGVGAAGYMKFDGETRALRTAKENAVKDAEQARMQSAEMVAKAEVQARNNLRQCEDKLKAAAAVVPAAPAVVSPSAPAVVEKKPEKPAAAPKVAARATGHKVAAARPSRRAAAEPAAAKKEKDDVPNIAKKKKLDNDPLAGLGKL
jgi:hypothetical protein